MTTNSKMVVVRRLGVDRSDTKNFFKKSAVLYKSYFEDGEDGVRVLGQIEVERASKFEVTERGDK